MSFGADQRKTKRPNRYFNTVINIIYVGSLSVTGVQAVVDKMIGIR